MFSFVTPIRLPTIIEKNTCVKEFINSKELFKLLFRCSIIAIINSISEGNGKCIRFYNAIIFNIKETFIFE